MRQNTKRGFTLIELLIVVAIIGLLASIVLIGLQGTRRGARDARRGADMHTVQLALESAFNKCGRYPMESINCQDRANSGRPGLQLWESHLGTELVNLQVLANANQLPQDPLQYKEDDARSYQYIVTDEFDPTSGLNFSYYIMRAVMEEADSSLLANDIDGPLTIGYTFNQGNNVSDGCGGPPAEIEYCVESQQ